MQNLNVDPYRDDFDVNKHFHRILFKPGRAVQARELTQAQTILQDQISKFAFHIFSQNTPVTGGNVTINKDCFYLKLLTEYEEVIVDVTQFLNRIIRDETGTVLARVLAVSESTTIGGLVGDPPTLIVSYISGQKFENGDVIYTADSSNFVAKLQSTGATGGSSIAHIDDGVFFIVNGYNISNIQNPDGSYSKYSIGHFVGVQSQYCILDKYGSSPTLRIGINITETIHDYINDSSLLDPAIGASNYQAPGADRLVIILTLETRTLSLGDDQGFIELVRMEEGEIKKQVNGTVYSVIDDYFAKRTYETNGNYIVNDFNFTPKSYAPDQDSYVMSVSKGLAYVNGYRLENQSDVGILGKRARTTANTNNSKVYFEYGNYFYVDGYRGNFNPSKLPKLDLHCVSDIHINTTNTSTYNSTLIGHALLRNVELYSGDVSDANNIIYKAFVSDIETRTITGKSDIQSTSLNKIKLENTGGILSTAPTVAYQGVTISITSGSSAGDSRTIIDSNAAGWITVDSDFSEYPDTTSNYTLKFGVKDAECFLANSTPLSVSILSNRARINAKYGKERGFATGYTKLVEQTDPEMIWSMGYSYVKSLVDTSYVGNFTYVNEALSSSGSGLEITLTAPEYATFPGSGTLSLDQIGSGFIISRTANGQILTVDGNQRTIYVEPSSKKTAKITINGLGSVPFNINVIAKVNINEADNSLRIKELNNGNTTYYAAGTAVSGKPNTLVNLTLGQVLIKSSDLVPITQIQSLYVTDVKRILKIYDTESPSVLPNSTLSNVKDVTKYYTFDNGQKDSFYDHAYIKLNFGAPSKRGNLLVVFDYYAHSGSHGYFSVMSYLPPKTTKPEQYSEVLNSIYTAKNGDIYRLSDSVDFRPSRKNGDSAFTIEHSYIVPRYLESLTVDYEYYLGRKDVLVLSKDRSFEIIEGVPSTQPTFPTIPDGSMDLVKITLDPYTAYVTGESSLTNIAIQKISHKTWKMKNISDLESRVNNIEYYTSLSLLEKNAQSLQIQDENGLNRFKYGILADDFTGFSVADTANYDFNAAILKKDRALSASHTIQNYPLTCRELVRNMSAIDKTTLSSFAVNSSKVTKYFSLPYTPVPIIQQKLASRTVNVNPVAVIDRIGDLVLSPPMDTFVDNLKLPSLLIADPAFKFYEPSDQANLLSQSDWKLVTGTEKEKLINTSRVTDTAGGVTVTNTFEKTWQESRNSLYGYYNQLNTNFVETNSFITDINVMPFIRHQEIEFNVKGLMVNTPLNCYFDNLNVNEYIRLPNLLKVTITSGIFKEGDVIGYLNASNVFVRTGKVIGIAFTRGSNISSGSYTGTEAVLYVVMDINVTQYGFGVNNSIRNATFNSVGAYSGSTATGNITDVLHSSGLVTAINGTVSNVDIYEDETGRDYSMIKKAESLGTNNNVYIPKTLYKKTVRRRIGATSITLSSLASSTANFYNGAILTVFNPNPINGEWIATAVISSYNAATKQVVLETPITFEDSTATIYSICRNTSIYVSKVSVPLAVTKNNPIDFTQPLPLMSSVNGMFCGIFKMPGGTFYSGTKLFRIDNGIDGNANSATTYAESVFFGSNLSTQSQSLQFASQIPGFTSTETANKKSTRQTTQYIEPPPPPPPPQDPLAQSFLIEGNLYPNGAFLNSVSLFFRSRSIDNPISLYIVETSNGFPTSKVLENSRVTLDSSEVLTSEKPHYLDSNTKTTFEFDVPVYIRPDTLYAFVVRSSAIEYTCWLAAQNDFALPSTSKNLPTDDEPEETSKLSSNPYVGTMFISQNSITWTPEQTKSLMFIVDACKFDITKKPSINFIVPRNTPRAKIIDFASAYYEDDIQVIANTTYSTVNTKPDVEYDAFNVSTLDFLPTQTKIDYSYDTSPRSTGLLTENRNSVNPGRYGTPSPQDIFLTDGAGVRILRANSNNSFELTASMSSTNQWVSPIISGDGVSLFTTKWMINELGIYSYNINIINGGYNYSNSNTGVVIQSVGGYGEGAEADIEVDPADGSITNIIFRNNGTGYAVRPKIYLNTKAAANTVSGSNVIFLKRDPSNGYIANGSVYAGQVVSNTANTQQFATIVSANNANGYVVISSAVFGTANNILVDVYGENSNIIVNCETCPNNGNGLSKYITKKVVLSSGNEAGDLRVYYTAYKPINTNIYVYYKILSGDDNAAFDSGYWQILTPINNSNRFSSSREDLIEYELAPGINNVANNNVSYLGLDRVTRTTFNQFAIKVVMSTTDSTRVPFLTDLRAIALPPGTGM
jgi:hypothetical protein